MIFEKNCYFAFETMWENSGSLCRSYIKKKNCYAILNNDFYEKNDKNHYLRLRNRNVYLTNSGQKKALHRIVKVCMSVFPDAGLGLPYAGL